MSHPGSPPGGGFRFGGEQPGDPEDRGEVKVQRRWGSPLRAVGHGGGQGGFYVVGQGGLGVRREPKQSEVWARLGWV